MAELSTLARPYARAAFEVARDNRQLTEWASGLAIVASLIKDATVQQLLSAPQLTAAQKSAALVDLCRDSFATQCQTSLIHFISVLAENKRLALLPFIESLFVELKAQYEKTLDVAVTSAFPLESALQQQLTDALTTKLHRTVTLSVQLDPSLIGGAIIRAGDTVIDASVRGRLAQLAHVVDA
jgi:F-type H+-transporting ATPase subunit delta